MATGDFMFDAVSYAVKSLLVFTRYSANERGLVGTKYVYCFEFPGVCLCKQLGKLNGVGQSYHENKKGDVFSETQCIFVKCKALLTSADFHIVFPLHTAKKENFLLN